MTDDCESYVHTDDEGAYTAEESEPYLKSEEEVYARAQAEFADLLQPQHSKVSHCSKLPHNQCTFSFTFTEWSFNNKYS